METDKLIALLQHGVAMHRNGRTVEAAAAYAEALRISPGNPDALNLLGVAKSALGLASEAAALIRQAIAASPSTAAYHVNLGKTLADSGDLDGATTAYQQASRLAPDSAFVAYNLGVTLGDTGRRQDAVAALKRATELDPVFAAAWFALGTTHRDAENIPAAIEAYRHVLALEPRHTRAAFNLANALRDAGNIEAAKAAYDQVISLDPANAGAHVNLANLVLAAGKIGEALQGYRRALDIDPSHAVAHSNLIFALDHDTQATVAEQQAERTRWFERHGRGLTMPAPAGRSREPSRRLRLGYVGDFRPHSASRCFGPILRAHDRDRFDVVCYSTSRSERDVLPELRAIASSWHHVTALGDEALAERIRADGIDILVDLCGHAEGNRLLAFLRKPAPIQVTAWGHATGTGIPSIDYFMADPVAVPTSERALFAETIWDLPCVIVCDPPKGLPPPIRRPIPGSSSVTFGCLNRASKISPQVWTAWARILTAIPDARLLLKDWQFNLPEQRDRVSAHLHERGVPLERLILLGGTSHQEHLAAYNSIDIALDPFPLGGGISTTEALWMGVPVVACRGRTVAGRMSASVLTALGLSDWIAEDEEQYVGLAIRRAGDPAGLIRLSAELRQRMAGAPVGNASLYTRAVETAYREMWRRWCANP